jgi:hypothetical protein
MGQPGKAQVQTVRDRAGAHELGEAETQLHLAIPVRLCQGRSDRPPQNGRGR